MLHVASPTQAEELIAQRFGGLRTGSEPVDLSHLCGRVLASDIIASVDLPGFDRSTMDGFALSAADTFGCSDSLPALLTLAGRVEMGCAPDFSVPRGGCAAIPTGGQLPAGCDAVVMVELTEQYDDVTVGILKPAAPGQHLIRRDDDAKAGSTVIPKGTRLGPRHIGALAALGVLSAPAAKAPVVGVLSTGNEVIPIDRTPVSGQVRDVNNPLLCAAVEAAGGKAVSFGICPDEPALLRARLSEMADRCDMLLLSGGSSVGERDAACGAIEALGTVLLHGLALKPGKPTLIGEIAGKPVFGLPGHPAAASLVFSIFARPLLLSLQGEITRLPTPVRQARLAVPIPANHGREEWVAVSLSEEGGDLVASPIVSKSGLIAPLARADGYLRVSREAEGLMAGTVVSIICF